MITIFNFSIFPYIVNYKLAKVFILSILKNYLGWMLSTLT